VTSASALGSFTLFDTPAGPELEYFISTQGLDLDGSQTADPNDDVTGLHIHLGAIGEVGPLVFGILNPDHDGAPDFMVDPVAGTLQGRWTPDDVFQGADSLNARVGDLLAGNLYIQFHTTEFPSSDGLAVVRGQILNSVPESGTLLLCGAMWGGSWPPERCGDAAPGLCEEILVVACGLTLAAARHPIRL
jgi:hypothetical protein